MSEIFSHLLTSTIFITVFMLLDMASTIWLSLRLASESLLLRFAAESYYYYYFIRGVKVNKGRLNVNINVVVVVVVKKVLGPLATMLMILLESGLVVWKIRRLDRCGRLVVRKSSPEDRNRRKPAYMRRRLWQTSWAVFESVSESFTNLVVAGLWTLTLHLVTPSFTKTLKYGQMLLLFPEEENEDHHGLGVAAAILSLWRLFFRLFPPVGIRILWNVVMYGEPAFWFLACVIASATSWT